MNKDLMNLFLKNYLKLKKKENFTYYFFFKK